MRMRNTGDECETDNHSGYEPEVIGFNRKDGYWLVRCSNCSAPYTIPFTEEEVDEFCVDTRSVVN